MQQEHIMQITAYCLATDLPSRAFRLSANEQPVMVVETPPMDSLLRVEKAAIRNLELVNMTFYGQPRPAASLLVEGDSGSPIGQLLLEDLRVNGRYLTNREQVPAKIENVTQVSVRRNPGSEEK